VVPSFSSSSASSSSGSFTAVEARVTANDGVSIHNNCTPTAITPAYCPLIEEAIAAYRSVFMSRVEEVRLMGSVARGEAIAGLSDIDFLAIVREQPTVAERAVLAQHAAALGQKYPTVSLVDLEASRLNDLYPTQRFILSSDSLSVYGDDRLTLREQTLHRDALIALVTPPLVQLLTDYGKGLARLEDGNAARLRFWSRVIGKDILKALRGVALRHGAAYERNIAAIAEQSLSYFPEHTTTIELIYTCYREPTADRATLLRALAEAANLPT
jgi:predicted nucleotidyltransferase